MPWLVNGQIVPEQVIREESDRIARDPQWQKISDDAERARSLRAAAEASAADRILIEQLAGSDPRPIDPGMLEQEIERMKVQSGCRSGYDDAAVRQFLERHLRVQRIRKELVAEASRPTEEEIEAFYSAARDNFRQPELFHAAHIVKYVNRGSRSEEALAAIQLALAELEQGEPFAEVAARHSDCGDKGGDLGQFPSGYMVPEFENAISALEPGQRTGIFSTPFGFHIAMLVSRTPAGLASLESVRADIERVMTFARQHEIYRLRMAELRARAEIRWAGEARAQAAAC